MVDHVLLIGFGGPEKPSEIMPFLKKVGAGRRIPEERLKQVEEHYHAIGGFSPYNEHTFRLARALEEELKKRGAAIPVFAGMRNWRPFLIDTLKEIEARGLKHGAAVILSTFRSPASCSRYKENLREALGGLMAGPAYDFVRPWHLDPLFIEAQAAEVNSTLAAKGWGIEETTVLFTAHSIPASMIEECAHCSYADELLETGSAVAGFLKCRSWALAYQSRSGNPQDPWLGPDILQWMTDAARRGVKKLAVVPAGFLCDNAEVLYDLDIEAAQHAACEGIEFARVSTIHTAPGFVSLLSNRIIAAGENAGEMACVL